MAKFHPRPPKIKKPPKPPPPPHKVAVPPVLNLSVSNADRIFRGTGLSPQIEGWKVSTRWRSKHNTVARQNPGAGRLVSQRIGVKLTLYRYKKPPAKIKPAVGSPMRRSLLLPLGRSLFRTRISLLSKYPVSGSPRRAGGSLTSGSWSGRRRRGSAPEACPRQTKPR